MAGAGAWEICGAKCGSDSTGSAALVLELVAVLESELATGDVRVGEVGESKSLEPVESFVRFFLRNPRVGIKAIVEEEWWYCIPAPALTGCRSGRLQRQRRAGSECVGDNGGYEQGAAAIEAASGVQMGIGIAIGAQRAVERVGELERREGRGAEGRGAGSGFEV